MNGKQEAALEAYVDFRMRQMTAGMFSNEGAGRSDISKASIGRCKGLMRTDCELAAVAFQRDEPLAMTRWDDVSVVCTQTTGHSDCNKCCPN